MKRWLWAVTFFATLLFGAPAAYTPAASIVVSGLAKDMVLRNKRLIIATDAGKAEVYTLPERRKALEISIPNVKDFMGDTVPARVLSVDAIDERYLILSDSGKNGYSDLYLYEKGTLKKLFGAEAQRSLIKARFIDEDHILLGYLGNEAALYEISTGKERYRVQLNESKFSDFALDESKQRAVFSNESGILFVIDTQSGKVLKKLQGLNVDNVYKVAFRNDTVAAAGQDRRGVVYDVKTGKGYYLQAHFLIYATALSPDAKTVAFAMDEDNSISLFNTRTKNKTAILKGQKSTLNVILFEDATHLFSASDDNTVMVWDLTANNANGGQR